MRRWEYQILFASKDNKLASAKMGRKESWSLRGEDGVIKNMAPGAGTTSHKSPTC